MDQGPFAHGYVPLRLAVNKACNGEGWVEEIFQVVILSNMDGKRCADAIPMHLRRTPYEVAPKSDGRPATKI
jgi:hypothetical protein